LTCTRCRQTSESRKEPVAHVWEIKIVDPKYKIKGRICELCGYVPVSTVEASHLVNSGKLEEAVKMYEEIIDNNPSTYYYDNPILRIAHNQIDRIHEKLAKRRENSSNNSKTDSQARDYGYQTPSLNYTNRYNYSSYSKSTYGSRVCPRCGGRGDLPQYSHIQNGICFRCGGSGEI